MGNLWWRTSLQYEVRPLVCEYGVKALSTEAFEINWNRGELTTE